MLFRKVCLLLYGNTLNFMLGFHTLNKWVGIVLYMYSFCMYACMYVYVCMCMYVYV